MGVKVSAEILGSSGEMHIGVPGHCFSQWNRRVVRGFKHADIDNFKEGARE